MHLAAGNAEVVDRETGRKSYSFIESADEGIFVVINLAERYGQTAYLKFGNVETDYPVYHRTGPFHIEGHFLLNHGICLDVFQGLVEVRVAVAAPDGIVMQLINQ